MSVVERVKSCIVEEEHIAIFNEVFACIDEDSNSLIVEVENKVGDFDFSSLVFLGVGVYRVDKSFILDNLLAFECLFKGVKVITEDFKDLMYRLSKMINVEDVECLFDLDTFKKSSTLPDLDKVLAHIKEFGVHRLSVMPLILDEIYSKLDLRVLSIMARVEANGFDVDRVSLDRLV